jgi:hypothetical protein
MQMISWSMRIGWLLIAIGAFGFLSTLVPLAFGLILLGVPIVFMASTAGALRRRREER